MEKCYYTIPCLNAYGNLADSLFSTSNLSVEGRYQGRKKNLSLDSGIFLNSSGCCWQHPWLCVVSTKLWGFSYEISAFLHSMVLSKNQIILLRFLCIVLYFSQNQAVDKKAVIEAEGLGFFFQSLASLLKCIRKLKGHVCPHGFLKQVRLCAPHWGELGLDQRH